MYLFTKALLLGMTHFPGVTGSSNESRSGGGDGLGLGDFSGVMDRLSVCRLAGITHFPGVVGNWSRGGVRGGFTAFCGSLEPETVMTGRSELGSGITLATLEYSGEGEAFLALLLPLFFLFPLTDF